MIYHFGDYRLDTEAFEIWRGDKRLDVEPQVLSLLILLIENREKVVSRERVFSEIWKDRVVSDAALSSRIKAARRLIGDDGAQQQLIRTVYGRGFRFVGKVKADNSPIDAANGERGKPDKPPKTRYARNGDLHIAYQTFGEGPVDLVVAPGFISHIENYWDDPFCSDFLRRLGKFARVALFDKRGTGLSDRVPHLPHMDERMDDLRIVMDAVGFERCAIMGISEGGSLASLFAAHHPERTQALVLYGSFARFTSWFPTRESLEQLFHYIRKDWGSGNSLPAFAPSMGGEYRDWWGKFERLGANPGAAIELMRMNSEIDISGILSAIQTPTLVVHRTDDVLIDPEAGDFLAANIPGARFVGLPGPDHLPWVGDNTGDITEAIRVFLTEVAPKDLTNRVLATVVAVNTESTRVQSDDSDRLASLFARFQGTKPVRYPSGFLSAFDRPARALRCAQASAAEIAHAKLGVHTGEVALTQDSIEGPAADMAADIAALASPGVVLVSRTVTDLVAGSGVSFTQAADKSLEYMPPDWAIYRLGAQLDH